VGLSLCDFTLLRERYTSFALKLLNKKAVIFSLGKKENVSIAIATVKFYFEE